MSRKDKKFEVQVFHSPEDLTSAAADLFLEESRRRIQERNSFTTALSGGTTPRALFQLLSKPPYLPAVEWSKIHFFWGDERSVPPSHADSNYRMAKENLLDQVDIDPNKVHRMETESDPLEQAALAYEERLRRVLTSNRAPEPSLDLILLGMGGDGHTASLFPHSAALNEKNRWVVPNYIESMKTWRMTLTAPFLNRASTIVFLVTGADKASRLKEVIEGPPRPMEWPSQLIQSENGRLIWMVDEAAASKLS